MSTKGKKNPPSKSKPKYTPKKNGPLREVLEVLLPAVILFLIIHSFIAEARFVPSPSMVPTIQLGDRFLVDKITYRFRLPARGEIVVFSPTEGVLRKAEESQIDLKNDLIKRIIGLPGETVEVRDGQILINDEVLDEPYIDSSRRPVYDFGPETIPEGNYWMLGDNRNRSWDGHVWGYIPREKIVGRAIWRFWPIGRMGIMK
jgi:signal peptidase I